MKIYRFLFFVACATILCSFGCDPGIGIGLGEHHPQKPYHLYPVDESINNSRTPPFSWRCEEADPAFELTFIYKVYLKKADNTGPLYEYESNEKSLQCPFTLDPETEYDFRVKAITEDGFTETSDTVSFTTGTGFNNPPHKPEIIIPAQPIAYSGSGLIYVLYPPGLTFSWTCYDPDGDDLTYDVMLALVNDEFVAISEEQIATEYQPTSLAYSTYYKVKITAHDAESETTSGQVQFLTADEDEYHGIYAELMIHRSQYISKGIPPDPDEMIRLDHVYARFDSLYAPDGPITPKQPAAVSYNVGGDVPLSWVEASSRYYKDNPFNGWFLAPGYDYTFTVSEGDDVPAMTKMIYYPECGPYLNSPDAFSNVSKEGFEVTWSGHDAFDDCPTNIRIRIMDMGPMTWTDVDLMVPNTGSYTFTSGVLSGLDPMTYQIQVVLIMETKEYIDEPGYDPRSWAWARTHSKLMLYLQ